MLTVLNNERPDRLPCQVHGWMSYYLETYLGGMDWWEAYEAFDMDYAIYLRPRYHFNEEDLARWEANRTDLGLDRDGNRLWSETIRTPKGELHHTGAVNDFTDWMMEHLIKNEKDFELWNEFYPIPSGIDFEEIEEAKNRLGDKGIIRSHPFSPGQGSPWQSFCTLIGTEPAIFMAMDEPDRLHHVLEAILQKTLRVIEMWEGIPSDLVETDGGAGSSTVISPALFREFCLPYDRRQNEAYHAVGLKVVCHLCGGIMPLLDLVVETGADGLETMTPPSMGGDCDLREASRRVGDQLFFIGGFDQNAGLENGTPEIAREQVLNCFEATKDHAGYILCPSDHFFHGNPDCLRAFAQAAKECVY